MTEAAIPSAVPDTAPSRPASPASVSAPEQYKVITRGVEFELSYSQITYDSPNHFTAAFLDHDFAEARSRTLFLDRDPKLFALIVEHLSGYEILPLAPAAIPTTMTPQVARRNLAADASYLELENLEKQLSAPDNEFYDTPDDLDAIMPYLGFCGLDGDAAARAERQLSTHDVDRVSMLRRSQHLLSHEYLTETLGLSQGAAMALMGRQTDAGWSSWDADCTERELDRAEAQYYREGEYREDSYAEDYDNDYGWD